LLLLSASANNNGGGTNRNVIVSFQNAALFCRCRSWSLTLIDAVAASFDGEADD
jgi:hypothetical protein